MKYIITESQYKKFIFDILDDLSESWEYWDIGDEEFDVSTKSNIPIFQYRIFWGKDHITKNVTENKNLYIALGLVYKIDSFLAVNAKESVEDIVEWFQKKYDVEVDGWDWILTHDDEDEDRNYV